ncbi:hypothetical protein SCHPADRAFT_180170 [Schizopora paradoxa]|uniref:Uncharacterized protein n=1 Tax=Schizopora paradoxa TaxID=27342 RepID=A0A0H2RZP8_9AGAM|nr:hypothetical protein SCHPADRAFT_180170 [Schizopora paradoxa]
MANVGRLTKRKLGQRIFDVVACRSCSRSLEADEVENGGSEVPADHHSQVKDQGIAASEGKDEVWAQNPAHTPNDSQRATIGTDDTSTSTTPSDWLTSLRSKCIGIVSASPLGTKDIADPSTKTINEDLSRITDTAASLVTFVLESANDLGSNFPGVGAVGMVLNVVRKVKQCQ